MITEMAQHWTVYQVHACLKSYIRHVLGRKDGGVTEKVQKWKSTCLTKIESNEKLCNGSKFTRYFFFSLEIWNTSLHLMQEVKSSQLGILKAHTNSSWHFRKERLFRGIYGDLKGTWSSKLLLRTLVFGLSRRPVWVFQGLSGCC